MATKDELGIIINSTNDRGLITNGEFTQAALPTTANKFAQGCILIGGNGKVYTNAGTPASPSFQDINDVATSEIADNAVTDAKLATANVGSVPRTATATVAGLTTGTLTAGSQHVTVTSSDANHIIILPAPVIGTKISLYENASGYELRSSDPATIAINGGTGASAESAIGGGLTVHMTCVSATAWTGFSVDASGLPAAVEPAA